MHAEEEGVPDKKHNINDVVLDLSQVSHAEGRRHACEKNKILVTHSGPIRSCDRLRKIKEICQIQEANGGYFAFMINKSSASKVAVCTNMRNEYAELAMRSDKREILQKGSEDK